MVLRESAPRHSKGILLDFILIFFSRESLTAQSCPNLLISTDSTLHMILKGRVRHIRQTGVLTSSLFFLPQCFYMQCHCPSMPMFILMPPIGPGIQHNTVKQLQQDRTGFNRPHQQHYCLVLLCRSLLLHSSKLCMRNLCVENYYSLFDMIFFLR